MQLSEKRLMRYLKTSGMVADPKARMDVENAWRQ